MSANSHPPLHFFNIILVLIGGCAGVALRHTANSLIPQRLGTNFPWATLTVNLAGCLIIGFLGAVLPHLAPNRPELRYLLVVGFLGGLTTFSSFAMECFLMLESNKVCLFAAYLGTSIVGGLTLVLIGFQLGRKMMTYFQ